VARLPIRGRLSALIISFGALTTERPNASFDGAGPLHARRRWWRSFCHAAPPVAAAGAAEESKTPSVRSGCGTCGVDGRWTRVGVDGGVGSVRCNAAETMLLRRVFFLRRTALANDDVSRFVGLAERLNSAPGWGKRCGRAIRTACDARLAGGCRRSAGGARERVVGGNDRGVRECGPRDIAVAARGTRRACGPALAPRSERAARAARVRLRTHDEGLVARRAPDARSAAAVVPSVVGARQASRSAHAARTALLARLALEAVRVGHPGVARHVHERAEGAARVVRRGRVRDGADRVHSARAGARWGIPPRAAGAAHGHRGRADDRARGAAGAGAVRCRTRVILVVAGRRGRATVLRAIARAGAPGGARRARRARGGAEAARRAQAGAQRRRVRAARRGLMRAGDARRARGRSSTRRGCAKGARNAVCGGRARGQAQRRRARRTCEPSGGGPRRVDEAPGGRGNATRSSPSGLVVSHKARSARCGPGARADASWRTCQTRTHTRGAGARLVRSRAAVRRGARAYGTPLPGGRRRAARVARAGCVRAGHARSTRCEAPDVRVRAAAAGRAGAGAGVARRTRRNRQAADVARAGCVCARCARRAHALAGRGRVPSAWARRAAARARRRIASSGRYTSAARVAGRGGKGAGRAAGARRLSCRRCVRAAGARRGATRGSSGVATRRRGGAAGAGARCRVRAAGATRTRGGSARAVPAAPAAVGRALPRGVVRAGGGRGARGAR